MTRRHTMSRKPAKPRHDESTKPKRNNVPKAARRRISSVADLQEQVAFLTRELAETREQQTGTAEIVRCCYKASMKHLTAIVALTLVPFAAAAQSTGVLATKRPITWGMIFALLFLMLGPIKLLGPLLRRPRTAIASFASASRPAPSYSRLPP